MATPPRFPNFRETDLDIKDGPVDGRALRECFKRFFSQLNLGLTSVNNALAKGITVADNIRCETLTVTATHAVALPVSLQTITQAKSCLVTGFDVADKQPATLLPWPIASVQMAQPTSATSTPTANVTVWFQSGSGTGKVRLWLFEDGLAPSTVPTFAAGGGGGASGSPSSLHTTTPRRFAMWHTQSDSQTDMVGFGIQNPTISPGGGRAVVFTGDRQLTQFNFNNVVNGFTGYASPFHWSWLISNCKFSTRIRLNYLPNNAAIFEIFPASGTQAWGGTYIPTINASNSDTSAFVAIGYDSRVGSNWIWGHCAAGLANWTDSGLPVSTTDDFLLTIESLSSGASVKVSVTNCTSGASAFSVFSSNLPTATLGENVAIGSVAWAASGLGVGPWYEYVYMEQN